ncbi:MAG: hypothetical protein MZV63_02660 [Marinilabiliales bacterium]|nr:hypothetical protein [Marinilabiliales bacterium]
MTSIYNGSVEALALPFGDGAGDPDIIARSTTARLQFYPDLGTQRDRHLCSPISSGSQACRCLMTLPRKHIGDYLGIE